MKRFGVRNFGEGIGRDVYAKKPSKSILVTHDNIPLVAVNHLGKCKKKALKVEIISDEYSTESVIAITTYKELIEKNFYEDPEWLLPNAKVVVLLISEKDYWDVYTIDLAFE